MISEELRLRKMYRYLRSPALQLTSEHDLLFFNGIPSNKFGSWHTHTHTETRIGTKNPVVTFFLVKSYPKTDP